MYASGVYVRWFALFIFALVSTVMGLIVDQEILVHNEHIDPKCYRIACVGFFSDTWQNWSPLRLVRSMMNFLVC